MKTSSYRLVSPLFCCFNSTAHYSLLHVDLPCFDVQDCFLNVAQFSVLYNIYKDGGHTTSLGLSDIKDSKD
ncbi:unnamed protein product [Prunus armeniaca]